MGRRRRGTLCGNLMGRRGGFGRAVSAGTRPGAHRGAGGLGRAGRGPASERGGRLTSCLSSHGSERGGGWLPGLWLGRSRGPGLPMEGPTGGAPGQEAVGGERQRRDRGGLAFVGDPCPRSMAAAVQLAGVEAWPEVVRTHARGRWRGGWGGRGFRREARGAVPQAWVQGDEAPGRAMPRNMPGSHNT